MQTEQAHGSSQNGSLRLGGARADFVAGLGRKVGDLRASLGRVRDHADDLQKREELRRKLHALASGAKLLKFDAMERAILEGLGLIDRTAIDAPIADVDLHGLEMLLEDLPALAWGENQTKTTPTEAPPPVQTATYTALVVGPARIAEALLEPVASERPTFACESTPDAQAAYDLAKATLPDIVVLDADLDYAPELVEALMDDTATEGMPIVVIGSFQEAGDSERYVAMGVAKTLTKPTNRETLRSTCEATLIARRSSKPGSLPPDPTITELGEKLAKELHEALVGRVDPALRNRRVSIGEGNEVLGALWGAIARVRDVVTARTDGEVKFFGGGPHGALPLAPMADDAAFGERSRTKKRGAAEDVKLHGRRVVVADDDPSIVWFISDLLKSAGCVVYEAFDGEQALALAYRMSPDLVISDILMPKLDGFSLCRALRRDVALRDVPVILLSWKEDLLQRVRELGAGAAGYVRKETDTRAILARVREALRAKARIEARLLDDGEVRGRLDGISVRTMLEIVCATRPEARVTVRDASFSYEVEIRWGAPQRATRTAGDGTTLRGSRVLAQMLGVGAGRFTVMNSVLEVEAELDGNLASQLEKPIARARAATSLLTGAQMTAIERVAFDDSLDDYLRATPERPRTVAMRLAGGESPRHLVLSGACEPSLLDDVLTDLSSRGLVTGLVGPNEVDLLSNEVERLIERGDARAAYAPRTKTAEPPACGNDEKPLCERSPSPGAIAEAMAAESPSIEPAQPKLIAKRATDEGTPTADQIVALAEQTIVEDTVYGQEEIEAAPEVEAPAEIPVDEASRPVEGTPLASIVTTKPEGEMELPKRKIWPIVAFVAATAIVAYAVVHWTQTPTGAQKAVETAPPPPAETARDIIYTPAELGLPPGQGVLEVNAPEGSTVVVDGAEQPKGTTKVPMTAGTHAVRVKQPKPAATAEKKTTDDDMCSVQVHAGRVAHVKFAE